MLELVRESGFRVKATDGSDKTYVVKHVEGAKFEYTNDAGDVVGTAFVDAEGDIVGVILGDADQWGNHDTSAFPAEVIALSDNSIFSEGALYPAINGGPGSLTPPGYHKVTDPVTGTKVWATIPGYAEDQRKIYDAIDDVLFSQDVQTWEDLRDYLEETQEFSVRLATTDLGDGVIADVIEITLHGVGGLNYASAEIFKIFVPRNNLETALVVGGAINALRQSGIRLLTPRTLPPIRTLVDGNDLLKIRSKYSLSGNNTVAAARTDIPGLGNHTYEGLSPALRREANLDSLDDLYGVNRPIKSPNPNPIASRYAEEDVFNSLARQIDDSGLTTNQLNGRVVNVHISNAGRVCNVCYQGFKNTDVNPGVVKQFSQRYPSITIQITAQGGNVRPGIPTLIIRGGKIIGNGG